METKSYTECLDEMRNQIIAKQNKLTDFNDGSVNASITEAVARQLSLVYIRARVGFDYYLRGLPYSVFSFDKKQGVKAVGKVVFSRSKPYAFDTPISSGTVVKSGDLRYLTTASGIVPANSLVSLPIPIAAEKAGVKFNVSPNTITILESVLSSDIVSVNNPLKVAGGQDEESEANRDLRFQDYIKGLQGTNRYGLKSALLELESVRSISLVEHFPPVDNIYNMTLYIDDGTGNAPEAVLEEALSLINGDGTASNPGRRAPGVNVRVLAPTIVPVSFDITIKTYRAENNIAISDSTEKIREYIDGLLIGEDVVLTTIVLLLRRISYIRDVQIITPLQNIVISDNQIARFGAATIIVEAQ